MRTITTVGLTVLAAAMATRAWGDAQPAGDTPEQKPEKTASGTVIEVDAGSKTVTARNWIGLKRVYHLGDRCTVATLDKDPATLNDLRPGEKVQFEYQQEKGVRVASRIAERRLQNEGIVRQVDVKDRTVTVEAATSRPTFHLTDRCEILLRNGKAGTLADVKPGDKITVLYQLPDHTPVAHRIQEDYLRFTGALNAVDLGARTAKAGQLFSEKKFNLGKGCEVNVAGKEHGQLTDLKLGKRYEFSYADIDGVNVVDHITEVLEPSAPETAAVPSARE